MAERGRLGSPKLIDYFLFTPGLFGEIPPFAIGRKRRDRWLQYRARCRGLYIDATEIITAIHQDHDYGPRGFRGHKAGPETQRNIELAGDQVCDVREATHKLTKSGVKRAIDLVRLKHLIEKTVTIRVRNLEGAHKAQLGNRKLRGPRKLARNLLYCLYSAVSKKERRIAGIGLGKIGFPLAVCLAHKGNFVVGVDSDPQKLSKIRAREAPLFFEKTVSRLWANSKSRFTAQLDAEEAARGADVVRRTVRHATAGDRTFGRPNTIWPHATAFEAPWLLQEAISSW